MLDKDEIIRQLEYDLEAMDERIGQLEYDLEAMEDMIQMLKTEKGEPEK